MFFKIRSLVALLLACSVCRINAAEPLKILHLTFHRGCERELQQVAKELSLDLTTWFIPELPAYFLDPQEGKNALYNIGHERAERIWLKHQKYFETFDLILTSDTAPLARIFLQSEWKKPLVIWICNRFDYCDRASLDCDFPDPEFYSLFREAAALPNIKIVAYSAFEHYYAKIKGIETGDMLITPFGTIDASNSTPSCDIPPEITKSETFFLPPYHNETQFLNLKDKCAGLGIAAYCGRYSGPLDLKDFKGIIHLPYAWSNLALFENIQMGLPYFIPSENFLFDLMSQGNYFHSDANYLTSENIELSAWYAPEHRSLFTYFDSWEDLKKKTTEADYKEIRKKTQIYAEEKKWFTLCKWKQLLWSSNHEDDLGSYP